jgi:hypothetical protein
MTERLPDLPTLPPHIERDWDRAREWERLCRERHCAYEALPGSMAKPTGGEERCPGYRSVLRIEEGQYLLRTSLCPRHHAWHERRRHWLRTQRAEAKRKPELEAPSGWRHGGE